MRKNILITGASGSLGTGMARQFAAMGRNLALCDRDVEPLKALQSELAAQYPSLKVLIAELDVLNYDRVFAAFREFSAELGGLDRVIVNAGVSAGRTIGSGSFEINKKTIEINVLGSLAQLEAAVEIFNKQGHGHLVAVSSVSAMRGLPRKFTAYSASKAGLATLVEGVRGDMINTSIRVTTLFPGFIRSNMTAEYPTAPFIAETEYGVQCMVRAIESETDEAFVPSWPWNFLGPTLHRMPLKWLARRIIRRVG